MLNLLIYVIHPSAAACLSNHVLRFSRFSYQKNDSWVANITLRCWRVGAKGPDPKKAIERARALGNQVAKGVNGNISRKPKHFIQPPSNPKSTEFNDDEPIYLPWNSREVWKATQKDHLSFESVQLTFRFSSPNSYCLCSALRFLSNIRGCLKYYFIFFSRHVL
jgi:hypothetical protein